VIDSFFLEVVKSERILHGNRDNIILVVSLKLADDSREGKLFTLKGRQTYVDQFLIDIIDVSPFLLLCLLRSFRSDGRNRSGRIRERLREVKDTTARSATRARLRSQVSGATHGRREEVVDAGDVLGEFGKAGGSFHIGS
jgi:hypothetical protein